MQFKTCPGKDSAPRHALVGTQFYDMLWSEHSYSTCPGRDAILQHYMVGTQFNTYPGLDAVLRHCLVGTQFLSVLGEVGKTTYTNVPEDTTYLDLYLEWGVHRVLVSYLYDVYQTLRHNTM